MPRSRRSAPGGLDHAAEREAVRVVDLPGAPRLSRLHDLVARGEERDARPAVDAHLAVAERRDETEVLRPQDGARAEHDGARRGRPRRAAARSRRARPREARPTRRALSASSCGTTVSAPGGIGAPVMMRSASRDPMARRVDTLRPGGRPRRAAGRDRPRRGPPRGRRSRPPRSCRRGDVERRDDVLREDASEPARDRERLLGRRARHVGKDAGPGFCDGNHGGDRYYTGRSAIVAAPMDDAREWTATSPRAASGAPAP